MASPDQDPRVAAVIDLASRAEAADGAAPFDEAVLLALRHDGLPGDEDLVEVREHAAGWLALADGNGADGAADLHLVVDPDERGQGRGAALAALLLDAHDGSVRAWSHGDHPAAQALADEHGFSRARSLWVMRRAADLELPPLPEGDDARRPDGVRLRHLGSEGDRDGDRDAVLALNAAAFADHPEQGALDVAGFEQRAGEAWFDPEGLLLAVEEDSGELLGFHWTKVHPADDTGAPVGEIYVLGVSPSAQGRGLGGYLSLAGLHHLRDRGAGSTLLYVEGDNTVAVATYDRLGFTHAGVDTHVQYAR